MIRPERRGNAIVSFMKASVAKCIREQPDIIQAKPVGIEGGAVYMKHASQTGELILMSLRPWRDIERRKSRQIMIGNVPVGGDAPVTVQTMTNTLTSDARATIDHIRRCEEAGADLRSEKRRVGKECVSPGRSRGSPCQ